MNKNIIIRMLGNDLKNLHNQNQTYDNLEFTLKHEPTFLIVFGMNIASVCFDVYIFGSS